MKQIVIKIFSSELEQIKECAKTFSDVKFLWHEIVGEATILIKLEYQNDLALFYFAEAFGGMKQAKKAMELISK